MREALQNVEPSSEIEHLAAVSQLSDCQPGRGPDARKLGSAHLVCWQAAGLVGDLGQQQAERVRARARGRGGGGLGGTIALTPPLVETLSLGGPVRTSVG